MIRRPLALALVSAIHFHAATAGEFHVSPQGDDQAPGTEERPFTSIRRAQLAAAPGDTVLIHGGVYQMTEADIMARDGLLAAIISITKSGTKGRPIRYEAAPGETRPVFDCSRVTPDGLRVSAFRVHASWVEIVGLDITGVKVNASHHTQSISVENLGDHNRFENLAMHDSEAIGLYIQRGADNLVLNCDAYRNHDGKSENKLGGNTDGFGCHPRSKEGGNNVFNGCRAWFNSDDGFDCINAPEAVTFINCWAFYNGFSPDFKPLADGNGFKAGGYGIAPGTIFPDPVPRHRVINCLSVRNRSNGFYANHHPGGIDWIHNTAYLNPTNFNFLCRNPEGTADIPGRGHKILNNLSYRPKRCVQNLDETGNDMAGNLFEAGSGLTDESFQNLDAAALTAPRKPDGDLPDTGFLRLKKTDAGSATPGYSSTSTALNP